MKRIASIRLLPTAKTLSLFDECECGDYRYQHENKGVGACMFYSHNIPDPRYNVCNKFRLFSVAQSIPISHAGLLKDNFSAV